MEHVNNFSCHTYGEGRTGNGQFVNFTCRHEEVVQVKEFLKKIRTIDIPTTGRVAISHGGCGKYTRYDIKQHDYAGGGRGYIEVLKINNPPEGHCGIVINKYNCGDSVFTEWETLENARDAFTKYWGSCDAAKEFPKLEGFKRSVVCNALTPWFYAIGDEEIIGDYAFPDGFHDDPIYHFGNKFVVFGRDGVPEIKTCMGARFLTEDGSDGYGRPKKYYKRLVYWDDGSFFDAYNYTSNPPRPLEENELWVTEAVRQFKEILTGEKTEFSINFTDGNRFIGKIKIANKSHCAEGRYELQVKIKGEKELLKGYADFKPQQFKNIVEAVVENYKKKGKEVEQVTVDSFRKINPKGKKWAGVYYSRQA